LRLDLQYEIRINHKTFFFYTFFIFGSTTDFLNLVLTPQRLMKGTVY